ncbi:MAG TPA: hypothetical protein PKE29_10860 [Phycisphaerales bacterium]|nr:hypothetical protein [Phycisphaerales bacterium]
MSQNLPRPIAELINWCGVHVDLWTDNAASIGLSGAQATNFKNLTDAMVTANTVAEAARQASKDATMSLQAAINAVRSTGAAYISTIKSYAETTGNNNVYVLAGVSPNDPPSTLPLPNAPQTFTAGVNPDGSLTIKWKVSQPEGVTSVVYMVSRRINGSGQYAIVSTEGSNKSFVDTTLPIGVDRVEYIVQPKRGTVVGPMSNVFQVQFGSVGGGGMSIMSTDTGAMKMAA